MRVNWIVLCGGGEVWRLGEVVMEVWRSHDVGMIDAIGSVGLVVDIVRDDSIPHHVIRMLIV